MTGFYEIQDAHPTDTELATPEQPSSEWLQKFSRFQEAADPHLLLNGNSLGVLAALPSNSVDMVMTSPPYWAQRRYDSEGIGAEASPTEFIDALLAITYELR